MTAYKKPYHISVAELAERGREAIPEELISSSHLIYSSPATLAYNSPGAQGYGVKRAALSIPGSVMLLVSPGCCGRNTSLLTEYEEYRNRFFFLTLDETDIVTGRHLRKIPRAVQEVYDSLETKPSVVMICITCVDALLGTDMERVCRKASETVGIPVLPSYMYALTREGRKPPMVHVRQSIYSLLEKRKRRPDMVNILGHFSHLREDSELYDFLRALGVRQINEIGRCKSYEEYLEMGAANFNLILDPEARFAAADLKKRLDMPSIELTRVYQIDKIRKQYQLCAAALGASYEDGEDYEKTRQQIEHFHTAHPHLRFVVGEGGNAQAFELSLALLQYGFQVAEIYANISPTDYVYVKKIAVLSPDTQVYSNLEPSMIYYDSQACPVDLAVGKDAAYYHPEAAGLEWNEDIQPFGYAGLRYFFEECERVLREKETAESSERGESVTTERQKAEDGISAKKRKKEDCVTAEFQKKEDRIEPVGKKRPIKGLWKTLSPFAPDQSGATAVLCEMGGLIVIIDAGGCAGNICGFDEPRWFASRSAIFSAGLRDMDAILGRDDRLVEKIGKACDQIEGNFVALVGTPVPAVIGTDYKALKRMVEFKTGVAALNLDTDGVHYYDEGCEKAWLALFENFTEPSFGMDLDRRTACYGIIGATPFDVPLKGLSFGTDEKAADISCYGMGAGIEEIKKAGSVRKNYVLAPSGLKAARYLARRFGTPYEVNYPLEQIPGHDTFLEKMKAVFSGEGAPGRILIVHQQVLAHVLRAELSQYSQAEIRIASWFQMDKELMRPGDIPLESEEQWIQIVREGAYDMIIADELLQQAIPDYQGTYLCLNHFPISGKALEFRLSSEKEEKL